MAVPSRVGTTRVSDFPLSGFRPQAGFQRAELESGTSLPLTCFSQIPRPAKNAGLVMTF
jgi:hypothetical protein